MVGEISDNFMLTDLTVTSWQKEETGVLDEVNTLKVKFEFEGTATKTPRLDSYKVVIDE